MAQRWVVDAAGTLLSLGNYDLNAGGEIKPVRIDSLGVGKAEPAADEAFLGISGSNGTRASLNIGVSSSAPITPFNGDLWYDTTLRFRYGTTTRALAWERRQRKENTDADFTLTWLTSEEIIRHAGTLTAHRAVTINTAGVPPGATFRITRTGGNTGGPWNLNVSGSSGGVLKAMATGQWGDFTYGATDGAWYLAASGALIP